MNLNKFKMKNQYIYRIVLSFFFLTIFLNFSIAQIEDFSLISQKGIAYSINGAKVRFTYVEKKENTFVFTTTNRTNVEIAKSNIAQIDLQKGNYAGKYAIGGALISSATLTSLYLLSTNSQESELGDGFAIILVASFSGALGGIIGAFTGFFKKKTTTIYNAPSHGYISPKLQLKTTTPNSIPSLTISYSF